MRFTAIIIHAIGRRSAIPQAFYDIISARMDGILAPPEILLGSVQKPGVFLAWLDQAPESQQWTATYHYVEPLTRDEIETNEFLVRATKRHKDGGRMHCNIAVQGDQRLTSVRLDFNGRTNLAFAGNVLKDLRDWLTAQGMPWDSIDIEIEGYIGEAHIAESLLAAFEFDEAKGHMIHKKGEIQQWNRKRK